MFLPFLYFDKRLSEYYHSLQNNRNDANNPLPIMPPKRRHIGSGNVQRKNIKIKLKIWQIGKL